MAQTDDVLKKIDSLMAEKTAKEEPKAPANEMSFARRVALGDIREEDIPDEVRENWMRSVFGNSPFSYTASLFDGKLKVTFCEPSVEFRNAYRLLSARLSNGMYVTLTALSILLYLKEMDGEFKMSFEPPKSILSLNPDNVRETEIAVTKEYNDLCGRIPSGIARLLPTVWSMYSGLISWFSEKGMPDSF